MDLTQLAGQLAANPFMALTLAVGALLAFGQYRLREATAEVASVEVQVKAQDLQIDLVRDLRRDFDALKREHDEMRQRLQTVTRTRDTLQEELSAANGKITLLEVENAALRAEAASLKAEVEQLRRRVAELEAREQVKP